MSEIEQRRLEREISEDLVNEWQDRMGAWEDAMTDLYLDTLADREADEVWAQEVADLLAEQELSDPLDEIDFHEFHKGDK